MPVEETRFMPFGQVVSNEAGRFARTMTDGLDCGSPVEYLERVLPKLADNPVQAARIVGLCVAVVTGNGDLVSEIEAYCENNK